MAHLLVAHGKRRRREYRVEAEEPHRSLRHTAATEADKVMSVHESMAFLGHPSARTTGQDTHVAQETLRARLEAMAVKGKVQ